MVGDGGGNLRLPSSRYLGRCNHSRTRLGFVRSRPTPECNCKEGDRRGRRERGGEREDDGAFKALQEEPRERKRAEMPD